MIAGQINPKINKINRDAGSEKLFQSLVITGLRAVTVRSQKWVTLSTEGSNPTEKQRWCTNSIECLY